MDACAVTLSNGAGRMLALRARLPMIAADSAKAWIDVAMPGTWEGHPAGPFTLTRETFESVLAAFNAQANPIPLDYNHQSVSGGEAPAAGWVHKMELRGDGHLWAFVEFTDRAAERVRAGEYRYCSPVFLFDAPDRKTGEPVPCDIHSIALTNTPFLDGQQPIALTRAAVVAPRIDAPQGSLVSFVRGPTGHAV